MANVASSDSSSLRPLGETLGGLVDSALGKLRQLLPGRVLALYVERQLDESSIARTSPAVDAVPAGDEYSLELRFASWLTVLDAPRLRRVPTYLRPWLPLNKVLVVPLFVDDCQRGAIIAEPVGLQRSELEAITKFADEISTTLREFERSDPQGADGVRGRFARSMHRISKNSPR
jgi:hypothetical protein